ncbi:MAG: hypothetical protein ABI992_09185 [Chthoniobacterales bacterium]
MKTLASRSRTILVCSAVFAAAVPQLIAADVVLQKVPAFTVGQAPAYPDNLARQTLGATIENVTSGAATSQGAEAGLLSGDPTKSYSLPAGRTVLLVALPKIENISNVLFANEGAQGNVTIATASAKLSSDSPQWRDNKRQDLGVEGVKVQTGAAEAKYVRLTFDLTAPGQIAGLGIYADPKVSDFTSPRASGKVARESGKFALVSYTDMHAKARALYVSSGNDLSSANHMIDDQTSTAYQFAVNDGSPTTVIDLGKTVGLHRMSAIYPPQAGKMEFYVLSALPGQKSQSGGAPVPVPDNAAATLTLNDAAFAQLKTVGTASDDGSLGRAAVDFPSTSGRYVMVRWIPAAASPMAFALAEVAAFGGNAKNTLVAANTDKSGGQEESEYQTDGKTMVDGKTMRDPKDMPGEGPQEPPAEGPPPSLPQPPPFTFVPVLVPVSN